ncbi:MAG: hypothetical protein Kow0080_34540 [Candidatus Promineifilaceae bacterium]
MITLQIVQKIWGMIQRPSSIQSQVEARELDSIHTPYGHPLVTIDVYNHRHLLLPMPDGDEPEIDTKSSGIHILSNEWLDANETKRYVDVVCLKPHLNSLFDMVILDILNIYPDHPEQPDKVCQSVLNRWRELLSKEKGKLPDKTALLGIWGELKLLLRLTTYNQKAVNAWLGPFSSRYDFFIGSVAIEVKSSMQRKGQMITVHGHDQLEKPGNGELYLALIKVEETPSQGENISELVSQLLAAGCNRLKLMQALNNSGLSAELIPESDDIRFNLTACYLYCVDDKFPKITSASFENGRLPNGIIDIVYKIDLSTQPPYPFAEEKAEQVLKQFAAGVK